MSNSVLGMFSDRFREKAAQAESDRRMKIATTAVEISARNAETLTKAARAALNAGDKNLAAQLAFEARAAVNSRDELRMAQLERHCARVKY